MANDRTAQHHGTREHRGRGGTPPLPARARIRPLPAIAIGNLDALGLPRGMPEDVDPANLSHAIDFGLLLIEAIDAALDADRARAAGAGATSTTSTPTPA